MISSMLLSRYYLVVFELEHAVSFEPVINAMVFGNAVECNLVCERREVRIKRELVISATETRSKVTECKVIAYRRSSERIPKDSNLCDCRHHRGTELHCSYLRLIDDTEFGVPLLFFENGEKQYALVIKLDRLDGDFDQVVVEVSLARGPTNLAIVDLERLRTRSLCVVGKNKLFVFVGGERVFRHLQ
jgi:hypothetical protein